MSEKTEAMSEEFHLTPLSADADTGELLEALGPTEERPPDGSVSACPCWTWKKFSIGRW
jgi:hypothetical protein